MTKMKSKKMTKSALAIIIMGIALVALLAFGGTYAYFTATTTAKTSSFTTGKVALSGSGNFYNLSSTLVVPGEALTDGPITYTNASTVDTYVAVKLEIKKAAHGETLAAVNLSAIGDKLGLAINTTNWVECATTKGVYILKNGGDATNFVVPATLSTAVNFTTGALKFNVHENIVDGTTSNLGENTFENMDISISISAYQVQVLHAESAENTEFTTPAGVTAANAESVWGAIQYMGVAGTLALGAQN